MGIQVGFEKQVPQGKSGVTAFEFQARVSFQGQFWRSEPGVDFEPVER